jgi:hypothetical protein
VVVREIPGQSLRDREQPGRLRREVEPAGVRPAHDEREPLQRGVVQPELRKKGVEAAELALVAELHVGDVIGGGGLFRRNLLHLARGHVQELGVRVDVAAHEPRAGDAVDFGPLARHPPRRGAFRFGGHLTAFLTPMLDTAFEVPRTERFRHVLADLVAVHAVDDDARRLRQGFFPLENLFRIAPQRALQVVGGFLEAFVATNVDDERRVARADGLPKVGGADARVHGALL